MIVNNINKVITYELWSFKTLAQWEHKLLQKDIFLSGQLSQIFNFPMITVTHQWVMFLAVTFDEKLEKNLISPLAPPPAEIS